jgi:hypothetical protein
VSKTIYNEPLLLKWSFLRSGSKVVSGVKFSFFREKITALIGFEKIFREKLFSNFPD